MRIASTALARLVPLACLALVACGGPSSGDDESRGSAGEAESERAAPLKSEETAFGDLVEKKDEVPAAVEEAMREHTDAVRSAVDAAESGKSDEPAQ